LVKGELNKKQRLIVNKVNINFFSGENFDINGFNFFYKFFYNKYPHLCRDAAKIGSAGLINQ